MAISIGRLAAETGISASAIRYYERAGVLAPADRQGVSRTYGRADVQRVKAVVAARRLGFTVGDLRSLATQHDAPDRAALQRFAAIKIEQLDRSIEELTTARAELQRLEVCMCETPAACAWPTTRP